MNGMNVVIHLWVNSILTPRMSGDGNVTTLVSGGQFPGSPYWKPPTAGSGHGDHGQVRSVSS